MIHYITGNGIGNAWVANELRQVQASGIPVALHTMRRPDRTHHASPWAADMDRQTHAIYPLPPLALAVSILLAPFLFGRRYSAALSNALFGMRENLRGRIAALAHFFVACHWARGLRHQNVRHIHAQWIHSNGTIGMYGAWLLGKTFSFTGHAVDLFRDRVALEDKIRRADFIICISTFHRDFYLKHGAKPEQLHIMYCGIDTTLFAPQPLGEWADRPFRIRSSGRLVEKKGFADLIDTCAVLAQRSVDFECTIGGSGPLENDLRQRIDQAGLADRVTLTGQAIKQEDIPAFMHETDVYCLPCVWASDNDVDGLPQMLMEAMACGRPVVSTRLVGIPDLVIHEQTGLLADPHDCQALADALTRLKNDPALAQRLAQAGREHVLAEFDITTCLQPILDQFNTKLGRIPKPQRAPEPDQGLTQAATERSAVAGRPPIKNQNSKIKNLQ